MFEDDFHGIVLFLQAHKETDAIVKVFTLEYGKQMFFVRRFNQANHALKAALIPFSQVQFIGQINRNGLSFLKEYRAVSHMKRAQEDIMVQAYASYIVGLADAVIDDRIISPAIFTLLSEAFSAINRHLDVEVITLMFELKLLAFFGTEIDLTMCHLTGKEQGPFDFSFKYGGLIHQSVWHKDDFRLHANANALFMLQKLKATSFQQLGNIQLSDTLKENMRQIVDAIYDEYVAIRLKSKKFIQDMKSWDMTLGK